MVIFRCMCSTTSTPKRSRDSGGDHVMDSSEVMLFLMLMCLSILGTIGHGIFKHFQQKYRKQCLDWMVVEVWPQAFFFSKGRRPWEKLICWVCPTNYL